MSAPAAGAVAPDPRRRPGRRPGRAAERRGRRSGRAGHRGHGGPPRSPHPLGALRRRALTRRPAMRPQAFGVYVHVPVLPGALRLLRLRHLHRPRPSHGALRRRLRDRVAAARRRRATCPRPPASSSAAARRRALPPSPRAASSTPYPAPPTPRSRSSAIPRTPTPAHLGAVPGGRGEQGVVRRCSRPTPTCWPGWDGATCPTRAAAHRRRGAPGRLRHLEPRPDLRRAGERDEDWRRTLDDGLALPAPPPHISAYALTVEPGHAAGPRRRTATPTRTRWPGATSWPTGSSPRRDTAGRRSPTGPGPGTGAATTISTGTRATTWASGRPPTATGTARRWWNMRTPERYIEAIEDGPYSRGRARGARRRTSGLRGAGAGAAHAPGVPWARAGPRRGLDGLVDGRGDRRRPHRAGPAAGQRGHHAESRPPVVCPDDR